MSTNIDTTQLTGSRPSTPSQFAGQRDTTTLGRAEDRALKARTVANRQLDGIEVVDRRQRKDANDLIQKGNTASKRAAFERQPQDQKPLLRSRKVQKLKAQNARGRSRAHKPTLDPRTPKAQLRIQTQRTGTGAAPRPIKLSDKQLADFLRNFDQQLKNELTHLNVPAERHDDIISNIKGELYLSFLSDTPGTAIEGDLTAILDKLIGSISEEGLSDALIDSLTTTLDTLITAAADLSAPSTVDTASSASQLAKSLPAPAPLPSNIAELDAQIAAFQARISQPHVGDNVPALRAQLDALLAQKTRLSGTTVAHTSLTLQQVPNPTGIIHGRSFTPIGTDQPPRTDTHVHVELDDVTGDRTPPLDATDRTRDPQPPAEPDGARSVDSVRGPVDPNQRLTRYPFRAPGGKILMLDAKFGGQVYARKAASFHQLATVMSTAFDQIHSVIKSQGNKQQIRIIENINSWVNQGKAILNIETVLH